MSNFIDMTSKAKPDLSNVDDDIVFQKEEHINGEITGSKTWSNNTLSMTNLPTADPKVAGQLWNNLGILSVSAG
jgi:hypothetical protein